LRRGGATRPCFAARSPRDQHAAPALSLTLMALGPRLASRGGGRLAGCARSRVAARLQRAAGARPTRTGSGKPTVLGIDVAARAVCGGRAGWPRPLARRRSHPFHEDGPPRFTAPTSGNVIRDARVTPGGACQSRPPQGVPVVGVEAVSVRAAAHLPGACPGRAGPGRPPQTLTSALSQLLIAARRGGATHPRARSPGARPVREP
jgi:hypothetical protein